MTRGLAWGSGILLLLATVAAALVLWPLAAAPLPDQASRYFIEGVRVLDVERGMSGAPTSVLVSNGRIVAIGAKIARPPDAVLIAGDDRFLAPGLWDMHVHSFQLSPVLHLPLMVAHGVTSVRDMMGCPASSDSLIACAADKRAWTDAAEAGRLASPRFVGMASYYLEGEATASAEVSARAAAARRQGEDSLKVYNRLGAAAYRRAAAEAKLRQLKLVGHLPKAVSLPDAVAAGQISFEHAHLLPRHCFARSDAWREGRLDKLAPTALAEALVAEHDPAACERAFAVLRANGAALVPTHTTREDDAFAHDADYGNRPGMDYLDRLSRWAWGDDQAGTAAAYPGRRGAVALKRYFDHGVRLTGAAHRAGVRVLVGTDAIPVGLRYHDELAHLVQAGLTPAEAWRAATIEAARFAGLEKDSGSIEVGKRADLLLLTADPLQAIGNSRRIDGVFLAGRLYDRRGVDALKSHIRRVAASPAVAAKLIWGFVRSSVAADL